MARTDDTGRSLCRRPSLGEHLVVCISLFRGQEQLTREWRNRSRGKHVRIYELSSRLRIDNTSYNFNKEELNQAGEYIQERVAEIDGKQGDEVDDESASNDEDPLDRIEKLADLRDNGVLTDEEFEEKKSELLDEI